MTQQLAIVDVAEITALRAEVRALHNAIKGATITPRPDWYSIPDAAKELGITVDTMRRKINAGKYQATGTGKSRRVRIYPTGV